MTSRVEFYTFKVIFKKILAKFLKFYTFRIILKRFSGEIFTILHF